MQRLTKEKFLERYKEKFNTDYIGDIPDNFAGQTLLAITCDTHGNSKRSAFDILGAKYVCQSCGKDARAQSNKNNSDSIKVSFESRITQFRKIHGNLFDYPAQEFRNSHSKIKIVCKIHGEFSLHMHSHIIGVGCPQCRADNRNFAKEQKKIARANEIIVGKQNKITANKARARPKFDIEISFRKRYGDRFQYEWPEYCGIAGKVTVTCKKHGKSIQNVSEHLKAKHGCPSCAKYATSVGEQIWISQFNVTDKQYRINLEKGFVKVDGYDSVSNTIYEYLGNYWHGHPIANSKKLNGINKNNKLSFEELFLLTEDRFRLLKAMDYNIIYVWENDIESSIIDERIFVNRLEY